MRAKMATIAAFAGVAARRLNRVCTCRTEKP